MLRYFSHHQLCQRYVLCRCVSTGSYAQTVHFMLIYEQHSECSTAGLCWLGLESACTLLLFLFLDMCHHLRSRCWRNTELRRSLPLKSSIGAGINQGLDVGGWWRWAVNEKSEGIATSWVDTGGPRLGQHRKRCCRTKDIRGKSLNSSFIVWVATSGLCDPENGERGLSWGWHPGCHLKWW